MLIRVLAGTVAGAVVFFLGGWLIYGILLKSYFEGTMSASAKAVMNAEPNFVPLILAQLAFGALFAYIFDQWATIRTFAGGLKAGAIIMFFLALGFDLQMTAFFKDMHVGSPYMPILVDIIAATILGAITGGVIGLVLGMMNKGGSSS
jgi:hypothetical protein